MGKNHASQYANFGSLHIDLLFSVILSNSHYRIAKMQKESEKKLKSKRIFLFLF